MTSAAAITETVDDRMAAGEAWRAASVEGQPFRLAGELEFYKASQTTDPKKQRRVGGCVTTDRLDRDGERVLTDGLDFSEVVKWGWYNDDHIKGTVTGIPEWCGFLKRGDLRPCGRPAAKDGWYTEGYLLDTPRCNEIWDTAVALEGTGRAMGFSIEGKILGRLDAHGNPVGLKDPAGKVVNRALVREIAITKKPVNTDSYMDLPALVKALEAGSDPSPTGGQPGDGGPLRPQSLHGVIEPHHEEPKMAKSKFHEFEAERKEKGQSPDEYQKALEDHDPNGAKLYASLCESETMRKSVRNLEAGQNDLRKSIDGLTEILQATRRAAPIESADLRKSLGTAEDGSPDVAPFIAEISESIAKSVGAMAHNLEANTRGLIAVGALTDRLSKALASRDDEIAELKGQIEEMHGLVKSLGNSPVLARGASDLQGARAIARKLGGKDEAGKENDVGTLIKSLTRQSREAREKGDVNRVILLGDILALAEQPGMLDVAFQKAVDNGVIGAN